MKLVAFEFKGWLVVNMNWRVNCLDLKCFKPFKRVPGDFSSYFVLYQEVLTLVLELKEGT